MSGHTLNVKERENSLKHRNDRKVEYHKFYLEPNPFYRFLETDSAGSENSLHHILSAVLGKFVMVVAPATSEPVTVDFVLVVESTANMVSHWESLKKSYICPAIQYFNGRQPSAVDYIGNHGNSLFSYVLFQAADQMPEPMTKCSRPTKSPWNFIRSLDTIPFTGGGSERHSLIAEGLGKALELFDGLEQRRVGQKTKKICFLVCNSPPYDLLCYESLSYSGMSVEKLAECMGNNGIELSVISPQFLQPLRQIYLSANQNKTPTMNYAQDSRHLVYISGFPLPTERDPVKLNQSGNQTLQKQALNASVTISSPTPSPLEQSPATSQSSIHNTGNLANKAPGNLQQPNSLSHALSSLTESTTSTASPVSTSGQIIALPQTAPVTAMSSAANFHSPISQSNQQQHNLATMKNPFTSNNIMGQNSSSPLFSNPMNSTLNQASSGNTHIKKLLMPTSQPQILLPTTSSYVGQSDSNSISSVGDMSSAGTSVPGITLPNMIASSVSVLNNQQANMRQMPSQSTQASSVRSGNMQQLHFVNSSSGLTGETNSTPYNTNQQMTLDNTVSNSFPVSSGASMLPLSSNHANRGVTGVRNNILPYLNNSGIVNQSTGNPAATEMIGLQPMQNSQMQHISQSPQQHQNAVGYVTTPSTVGAGPVQTNNPTQLQAAQSAANDVMRQAEISANPSSLTSVFQYQHQTERVLWSGTLEWTEKRKPAARTTHALSCHVYVTPNQNDDGINAGTWPSKLTMQLIPHIMFSQMQAEVKNNRTVSIKMSPPEHVQSLANIMKNRWMGLIQIHPSAPNPAEMKVLLVIYSQKKSQFFGLLPMDPVGFIARIRQIISTHQNRMATSNAGAVSAHTMTGNVTGMNVDGSISNLAQFGQDTMKRVPQPNTGQGQFMHNQITIRPNNQGGMHQISNTQNVGIRNVNMNQVVPGQVSLSNQRVMDPITFRPNIQRMPGNTQLTNQSTMMNQQQQQAVGQQMQQQQQGSNPNQQQQYMYNNMNQQRTMVGNKQGMGNVEQSDAFRQQQMRFRLQQQQQSQQQGQRNMQMNQVSSQGMTGNERQLRALLQSGQTLGNQNSRPRMQVMTAGGIRQPQQAVMRPGFMQTQQVRRPVMSANRMLGMQQSQQGFGGNMQQNQQQPPML